MRVRCYPKVMKIAASAPARDVRRQVRVTHRPVAAAVVKRQQLAAKVKRDRRVDHVGQ